MGLCSVDASSAERPVNYEGEIAEITLRLQTGRIEDAREMAQMLVTGEQIKVALREFDGDEDVEPAPMKHRLQGEIAAMLVRIEAGYADEALEMGKMLLPPSPLVSDANDREMQRSGNSLNMLPLLLKKK